MKKLSQVIILILAIAMPVTFMLAGCSGTDSDKAEAENTKEVNTTQTKAEDAPEQNTSEESSVSWDAGESRKIVFSTIKNYYTTALKQIAKEYNEMHPETEVEIEIIGDNDTYLQNFKTKMSSDKSTAPDIVHTNILGEDEGALINKNWLMALDDLLEETNPYNEGQKVKDAISDPTYLALAVSSAGKTSHLPFDLVGVGVFYNQSIFDEVGVTPPATYKEWVDVCGKLKAAGYDAPIGATSFNQWIMASLSDWAYRKLSPELASLPGDARYNEQTMPDNATFKYDANDPAFDMKVVLDNEKFTAYAHNMDYGNSVNQKMWETFKSVAQFFPENWVVPDDGQAYAQFMAQKTPMIITGSWVVGDVLGDMSQLSEDKSFSWGTFLFPGFASDDPDFEGDPRGLKVAGHKMGIADKGDTDLYYRAADFLKYMYSPSVAARIYDITISSNEYVQGPSLIKGVTLGDEITAYLEGFNVKGNMKLDYNNLFSWWTENDKPEYLADMSAYIDGTMTFEAFAEKLNAYKEAKVEEQQTLQGYDLDPTTNDTPAEAQ